MGSSTADQIPHLQDNRSIPSQSMRGVSSPSAGPISRRRVLRDDRRSTNSRSIGTGHPYINTVNRLQTRPPPRVSRSLSNSEVPRSTGKRKAEESESLWMGTCGAFNNGSGPPRPSRREDILRGMAKLKALEAIKNSSTTKSNG